MMQKASRYIVAAALIFVPAVLPSVASAQTYENRLTGLTQVHIVPHDSVKDSCWPAPDETAKEVELELLRSKVKREQKSTTILNILVTGFEITRVNGQKTGTCAVSYGIRVEDCAFFQQSYASSPNFGCYGIYSESGLLIYPKNSAQREVNQATIETARQFLYDLEKDRQGIASK